MADDPDTLEVDAGLDAELFRPVQVITIDAFGNREMTTIRAFKGRGFPARFKKSANDPWFRMVSRCPPVYVEEAGSEEGPLSMKGG